MVEKHNYGRKHGRFEFAVYIVDGEYRNLSGIN